MPEMFNEDQLKQLGLHSKVIIDPANVGVYVAAIIRKERERLAAIFKKAGMNEAAQQITDSSNDMEIFRFGAPIQPKKPKP